MKIMYCVRFLQLLFLLHIIDAQQHFIELPMNTVVNPGQNIILKCRIFNKRGICSWQKDNKTVGIYSGKYEWATEDRIKQNNGDCSLLIRAASLKLDDGQWQCQVTASYYDAQDSLSSRPATFSVRIPPQIPTILYNESLVPPDGNITVPIDSSITVECESRYGNPPAHIEWYLERKRQTGWNQTNSSEVDMPRAWAARSVLQVEATKSMNGNHLSCRAYHPSYPAPHYKETHVILDVTFTPEVSIIGSNAVSLTNLEEGSSRLSLECRASGNPRPYTWWTRNGQIIGSNGGMLVRSPVNRNDSGIYECQANNSVGMSEPVKIELNIKFTPRVIWVGPRRVVEADLFSNVTLECKAIGNPSPSYQWYYNPNFPSVSDQSDVGYPVASSPRLLLHGVSYNLHGRYTCMAFNHIRHEEKSHTSEPVTLKVLGPPVAVDTSAVHAWRGSEGSVQAYVYSDPPPLRAVWLWDSLRVKVPSLMGRFKSTLPSNVSGYYQYTLLIDPTRLSDARVYMLLVKNSHGHSSLSVTLHVHDNFSVTEKTQVAPLVTGAMVVAALLVLTLCLLQRYKRRNIDIVEYKVDNLDSKKAVLNEDAECSPRDQPRTAAPSRTRAASAVDEGAEEASPFAPCKPEKRCVAVILHTPATV